ncbi:MAG TPA: AAA family ATPase [Syntrophales bacterium]|nr:AAA family ATPase [Syntrophales bacterium]HPQ42873.1 AAA family ATPase [Syntrophales bacterium]
MDYFRILNLVKEPFSNSPEPEFFYQSEQHVECLQKLELAVRLRRGLNVVIGDVGTGKTTLCRQMIRRLAADKNVETYLMIDPYFSKPMEFLHAVSELLGIDDSKPEMTEWQVKEEIKNHLYAKGVGEQKILVLIIDEGQKIPDFCLEMLREFLNYETNEYKLLQIVIFAQKEFYQVLEGHPGFADRINLSYDFSPMNFADTRAMIRYRLDIASGGKKEVYFTFPALWAIYRITKGYPRKIVRLCHQIILALIVQNRTKANWSLARFCAHGEEKSGGTRRVVLAATFACLIALIFFGFKYDHLFVSVNHSPSVEAVSMSAPVVKDLAENAKQVIPVQSAAIAALPEKPPAEVSYITEKAPVIEEKYPPLLGRLGIRKNETVSGIVRRVYGVCDPERLAVITDANPHIKDLNRVVPGEVINLPAIPSGFYPAPEWICWVQVAQKGSLEDIYALCTTYPGTLPPIQIFPCWNGREGLTFTAIMEKGFTDEESAQRAIDELPRLISSGAKVITKWDEDTVFFSTVASR